MVFNSFLPYHLKLQSDFEKDSTDTYNLRRQHEEHWFQIPNFKVKVMIFPIPHLLNLWSDFKNISQTCNPDRDNMQSFSSRCQGSIVKVTALGVKKGQASNLHPFHMC